VSSLSALRAAPQATAISLSYVSLDSLLRIVLDVLTRCSCGECV
jgi:hypothetical protein